MLRRVAMLALVTAACTTDFFLEAGTDAATDDGGSTSATAGNMEGSSTGDPSTTVAPTTTDAQSEGGTEPTTDVESSTGTAEAGETSTVTGDPTGAEEASAEEASAEEASAEEGSAGESGGEGGVLDCLEVDGEQEGCEAHPACDWYAGGPCFADACHPDAAIACEGFSFGDCNELPLCAWFGEPRVGECGATPCGELDMSACLEAPACNWVGEEPGNCEPVECPECYVLGELDCMANEACTWFDAQATCAPD